MKLTKKEKRHIKRLARCGNVALSEQLMIEQGFSVGKSKKMASAYMKNKGSIRKSVKFEIMDDVREQKRCATMVKKYKRDGGFYTGIMSLIVKSCSIRRSTHDNNVFVFR